MSNLTPRFCLLLAFYLVVHLVHAQNDVGDGLKITPKLLTESDLLSSGVNIRVQGLDLTNKTHPRFNTLDDPQFASRTYDDSSWPVADDSTSMHIQNSKVCWVRMRLLPSAEMSQLPVDLHLTTQGAFEIYYNGRLLERIGQLPAPDGTGEVQMAPYRPRRVVRLPLLVDGAPEILAIRFVYYPNTIRLLSDPKAYLNLQLHTKAGSERIAWYQTLNIYKYGAFFWSNIIIVVLSILLAKQDKNRTSWLLLGLFSINVAMVAFTNSIIVGLGTFPLPFMSLNTVFNTSFYSFSVLALVLVLQSMFSKINLKTLYFFSFLILLYNINYLLDHFYKLTIPIVSAFLLYIPVIEITRMSFRAIRHKLFGSWIIGLGALLYVFFAIVLEGYFDYVSREEKPYAYLIIIRISYYVAMPASITIFLARRAAYHHWLVLQHQEQLEAKVRERTAELRLEKERSEALLLNILPYEVAEEIKTKGIAESQQFNLATVLFSDFKDFTALSENIPPKELVEELNICFKAFDDIMSRYTIEKIKTIGDAYMAAGGLPDPGQGSPLDVVHAALDMQEFIQQNNLRRHAEGKPAFVMRIGIHSGPVVAGVVGVKKFAYDIWGDTVNTAARLESSGEAGQVNISASTYAYVKNAPDLSFTERGTVTTKGKGGIPMYFVERQG